MNQGRGILRSGIAMALAMPLTTIIISEAARGESPTTSIAEEINAEFGYAGGATTRAGGASLGSVDELDTGVRYIISPQISRRLYLRFGAQWQRVSFGAPEHSLVPNELDQIAAIFGFDWQLTDNWLLRAELQPGIYSDLQRVGWRSVDAPLLAGAVYVANADLQWLFGVRVVPRSEYPVLPALGVRWKFADEWTLNLLMPNPRLEYDVNDRVKVYLGADVKAGTYTMGDHFGTDIGRTALNGAILDTFEVRVGPGISWKVRPNLTLDANAGCMAYRTLRFSDDVIVRSQPAPYVQIAFHWQF